MVAIASSMVAVWLLTTVEQVSSQPAGGGMLQVAPEGVVSLASLPVDHQAIYEAAAADPEAFTAVRCYCGCESFLGHDDLLACFVRADGDWEAHATGCAVCLAQAEQVIEHRAQQLPIEEIVARIDGKYGAIDLGTAT